MSVLNSRGIEFNGQEVTSGFECDNCRLSSWPRQESACKLFVKYGAKVADAVYEPKSQELKEPLCLGTAIFVPIHETDNIEIASAVQSNADFLMFRHPSGVIPE